MAGTGFRDVPGTLAVAWMGNERLGQSDRTGVEGLSMGVGVSGGTARRAPEREGEPIDAGYVVARLEDAGRTLISLPNTGYSTRMRSSALEVLRAACEAEESAPGRRLRLPVPSAARIGAMDQAWSWLGLIPTDRYVLRRIVGARALVSPTTERHLFSWRRLGGLLGADHRAVQRWHAEGIGWIVKGLAPAA